MSDQIQVGDVVVLKSGGPRMTVANVDRYGYEEHLSANCDWFVADKSPWKHENGTFPLTSLKKAE
ncbi:YodC family protein [Rhizobium leguminosarum]|uniref:YodC family protein n=1 Tax=Rhizobium leguminosarum TaxID=384 RepID=UPI003F973D4A